MFRYKLNKKRKHLLQRSTSTSSRTCLEQDQQQPNQQQAGIPTSSDQDLNVSASLPIAYTRPVKRVRYDSSASDFSEYSYCSTETEDDDKPATTNNKHSSSPPTRITSLKMNTPANLSANSSAYVSEEESIQRVDSTDAHSLDSGTSSASEDAVLTSTKTTPRRSSYIQTKKSVRMTFDDYFEQIKTFKEAHGHMRVTPKYDKKLANWVADMRNIRRQKNKWYGRKVTEKQLKSLDDLGFIWNPTKEAGGEKSFEYRIEQLKKFKAEYGHLRVTVKQDKNLSYFCSNIRAARRHAGRKRILKVTKERIKALDDLGFAWEPKPTQGDLAFWNHIKEMKAFKDKHGHVHITAKLDKKLAIFCTNMRNARRKTHTTRRLTEDRIKVRECPSISYEYRQQIH